ncbi:MAG TPA: hypothetical protein VK140_02685 [Ktedonobacteraceae bacterium]|nr:hypothetical protein [Ktedonobacteraceae bacterium]
MNSTPDLSEQVSELRWLAYELGNEMKALETTAHPLAHRFLMHGLTRRMAQVAQSACSFLTEPVTNPVEGSPALAEPQRAQASSQKGQETS